MITAFIYLLIGSGVLIMAFAAWVNTDNGQLYSQAIQNLISSIDSLSEEEQQIRNRNMPSLFKTLIIVNKEYKRLKELRG